MTPLYARIRPESKYADQDTEKPFAVKLQAESDGYIWSGGPGGQYRHSDLQLFTLFGDHLVEVPIFANGDEWIYLDIALNFYERQAKKGELYPENLCNRFNPIIDRLQAIQKLAKETYQEEEY